MSARKIVDLHEPKSGAATPDKSATTDPKERLMVSTLEFSRRLMDASDSEELYFMLTNDIRVLIEFDRCSLIRHDAEKSELVAVNNQMQIETKARYQKETELLGKALGTLTQPVLLSTSEEISDAVREQLGTEASDGITRFLKFSKADGIFCAPLMFDKHVVGHLVFEFMGKNAPDRLNIMAVLKVTPFCGRMLGIRKLVDDQPRRLPWLTKRKWTATPLGRFFTRLLPAAVVCSALLFGALFAMPVPFTVGGEAEVVPMKKRFAFSAVDGIIDEVNVAEGDRVKPEQVLAVLDPTELDHKIRVARRKIELLTEEMDVLSRIGADKPEKLGERRLVILRRKSAEAELAFLNQQRRLLEIHAPVAGVVLTKDVASLVGKRLTAGEAFCEIAPLGKPEPEVLVSEDRISGVQRGQDGELFLNANPLVGLPFTVRDIAPRAESLPRLGNVYRVRGTFTDTPPDFKVGMKGVGKIFGLESNLWNIVSSRLAVRFNEASLWFR